jgi:hypothetical protein
MTLNVGTRTVACPPARLLEMIEPPATGPSGSRNKTICYPPEPRR